MMNILGRAIHLGKIDDIESALHRLSLQEQYDLIMANAKESGSIVWYTIIWFKLFRKGDVAWLHYAAFRLLNDILCDVPGRDIAAQFHAMQALLLEPRNALYADCLEEISRSRGMKIENTQNNLDAEGKQFVDFLRQGHVQQALVFVKQSIASRDLANFLVTCAYYTEWFSIYTIACLGAQLHQSAQMHYAAAGILVNVFPHLEGAESSALIHARRAVELAPSDYRYKEFLLLFHSMPYGGVSHEEGYDIAQQILEQNKGNITALNALERIRNSGVIVKRRHLVP